jgi:hypothetical protein
MLHGILLASLISLVAIADVSAQTTPARSDSFGGLAGGRTLSVIDESGFEWTGRLLLFTPDTLTLDVNGGEVLLDRKNVQAVYERGNSAKKGFLIGLASGPALALAAVATGDPSPDGELAVGAVVVSALGAAIGAAVDAMIPGKRLVYAKEGAFTRQDSNTNGIVLGMIAGAGAGFIAGVTKDDCDHTLPGGYPYFDCTADEKIAHGFKVAALPAVAGAGIGFVIDRMIVGRRLGDRTSIRPMLSRSALGLSTSVSW